VVRKFKEEAAATISDSRFNVPNDLSQIKYLGFVSDQLMR